MQYKSGRNCVVTGGAGFIGSHACQALMSAGWNIACVDNFNDFYDIAFKENNIKEIEETAGKTERAFEVYRGDIRDTGFLEQVFQEAKPELVIHLAACAGVRPSIQDPTLYIDVNINGTVSILETIKKHGVNKLVFASSSSVYGNNHKVPFSERDSVDNPISPYAATKKAGELLCYTYHHLYDINTACLRFFTVYGPRQRPDLAIYKFTKLISEGKKVPFYGDGSTRRDYTYIDDIVGGVMKACKWLDSGAKRYGIFNLGESNTVTLTEMIDTIEKVLGRKASLDIQPNQPGDVGITYADISNSKEVLGYDPGTGFEQGIRLFIDWYKKNRSQ